MVLWGYDTDNRPALYLRPSKQNTEESIRQVHFVVWALERLTELMGPGVEYVQTSSSNASYAHVTTHVQDISPDGRLR